MKLYLIRHGRTEANIRHLYCGSQDLPLLEGETERLKRLAAGLPRAERFYISGMRRTLQTLKALYGDVAYEVIPELKETCFGIFEMTSYEENKEKPEYIEYISGDFLGNVPPCGESFLQMKARSLAGIAKVLQEETDCAVVTHGGNITALMGSWFPEKCQGNWSINDFIPEPGSGYAVEFDKGVPVRYGEFLQIF